MPMQLNEYRAKLIDKILFSHSQEEVKRYIDAAQKALIQNNVNGHIITRFIEKILSELESFDPMNKDALQWSNIKMAIILFTRLKTKYNTPA